MRDREWDRTQNVTVLGVLLGIFVVVATVVPIVVLTGPSSTEMVPPVNMTGMSEETEETPMPIMMTTTAARQRRMARVTTTPNLANVRALSNAIFNQNVASRMPDPRGLSALVFCWGQFIDHDVVLSDLNRTEPPHQIPVPVGDPWFALHAIESIPMGRTRLPVANLQTPLIDASTVYGTSMTYLNEKLRAHHDGLLRLDAHELLPLNEAETDMLAGDPRATEQVALAALHTLWAREHNRLARELKREHHPEWNDDQLFAKARQLVIAEIQHITYHEWLPALLGTEAYRGYIGTPHFKGATPAPLIFAEFAGALFRMGHSMVPEELLPPTRLKDLFHNLDYIREHGIEAIIHGVASVHNQRVDARVVHSLRNMLFGAHGMDLVSLNIARGRELELPSYQEFTQAVGITPIETEGITDLYIGALMEPPLPGSSVGATLAYGVGRQLRELRDRDPNYYEFNEESIGRLYYHRIRQTTLADVVARNTVDGKLFTRRNLFYVN